MRGAGGPGTVTGLRVIGVRHGEVLNPDGVIYAGLPGYGLSDLGRRQAVSLARALSDAPVAAVYASPLDRSMETAESVASAVGLRVIPDERLHEWRFWSRWGGMTWDALRSRARDEWEAYQADPGAVTQGESLAQLADRVSSWLGDVRAAHDHGVVVGISHLEPLRAMLLRLTRRPPGDLFAIRIGLCEAVRLAPDPDPAALSPAALQGLLL